MQTQQRLVKIDWKPQPRQLVAIKSCGLSYPFDHQPIQPAIADIIGYGGAAGGGKTDTLLAIAILAGTTFQKINIGYFRREFPQLEGAGGAIQRSRELMQHFCKYNEQKHRWTFPNGSILQFNHCADPSDVGNYLSQQFDILLFDEVTQFERDMIKMLLTRNRQTINDDRFKPFAVMATNPGGVGTMYFKEEFVDLGTPEQVNIWMNESNEPERHLFIPSKLYDNAILMQRDPKYAQRLGSTEMSRKIYLEGDWDYFQGQAFAELTYDKHVIPDFKLDKTYRFFCAFDMGFNHPFSFGVFAVARDGQVYLVARATNRLKRVDEIARIMQQTVEGIILDDGTKLTLQHIAYFVAGWDCWTRQRDGSPTIAEQFQKTPQRIILTKAREDRVQAVSQIQKFIAWKGTVVDQQTKEVKNGEPLFYIFESCRNVYSVLANMQFDTDGSKPEDVKKVDADENGKGGDDDYDMVRYGLMSRPRPGEIKKPAPPKNSVLWYVQQKQQERASKEELYGY